MDGKVNINVHERRAPFLNSIASQEFSPRTAPPIQRIRCPQCGGTAERRAATGETLCPSCGRLWVR